MLSDEDYEKLKRLAQRLWISSWNDRNPALSRNLTDDASQLIRDERINIRDDITVKALIAGDAVSFIFHQPSQNTDEVGAIERWVGEDSLVRFEFQLVWD